MSVKDFNEQRKKTQQSNQNIKREIEKKEKVRNMIINQCLFIKTKK